MSLPLSSDGFSSSLQFTLGALKLSRQLAQGRFQLLNLGGGVGLVGRGTFLIMIHSCLERGLFLSKYLDIATKCLSFQFEGMSVETTNGARTELGRCHGGWWG